MQSTALISQHKAASQRDGRTSADTAIDIRKVNQETASFDGRASNDAQRSDFGENQGTVGTAKAERIFYCDIDRHLTRLVGAVIEIAARILIEDIDRGW